MICRKHRLAVISARARIALPRVITDNLYPGKKLLTQRPSRNEMQMLWPEVVGPLEEQRLAPGVYAEMPRGTSLAVTSSKWEAARRTAGAENPAFTPTNRALRQSIRKSAVGDRSIECLSRRIARGKCHE
jgi:hypothetical protein